MKQFVKWMPLVLVGVFVLAACGGPLGPNVFEGD